MRKKAVENLIQGVYRLHWKSGGSSLAAVGETNNGDKWMAPVNWLSVGCGASWKLVRRAELLMKSTPLFIESDNNVI